MKKIGLIILIVLAVLLVFRDFFIKQAIVMVGSNLMGASVSIGGFSLSTLTHKVKMSDVKLYNPKGFDQTPLIDIAHVYVDYNLGALMKGKQYFSLIDLDVRKLAIQRNNQGKFNVASLDIKLPKSDKPLDMKIDVLKLNVAQVTIVDKLKSDTAQEKEYSTPIRNKTFRNITSPQQLVGLVLFDSAGLGALKNLALSTTKEVFNNVDQVANQVTGTGKEVVGSLWGTLKNAVDK